MRVSGDSGIQQFVGIQLGKEAEGQGGLWCDSIRARVASIPEDSADLFLCSHSDFFAAYEVG